MHTLNILLLVQLFGIVLVSSSTFQIYGLDYTARRINYCPSQAQVNQDMQIIDSLAHYVRLYSLVDCNQGSMVLQAIRDLNLNLRVTLGMWLDIYYYAEFPSEYAALISLNQNFGLSKVDSIIVGSETQYRGDFSASLLISFIQNVSITVKQQMGYSNIQITTADVIDSLIAEPQVISAVDFVAYNEFAFWENIAIQDAVQKTITRYNSLIPYAQGKRIVISEAGWPYQGPNEGVAVPSAANENTFFQGVVCWAVTNNIPLYYFAAFDSLWQQDEDQKYWGIYDENRNLKAGISLDFPCSAASTATTASATSTGTSQPTESSPTTGTSVTQAPNRASTTKATTIAKASSTKTHATSTGSVASSNKATSTAKAATAKIHSSSSGSVASSNKATSTAKAATAKTYSSSSGSVHSATVHATSTAHVSTVHATSTSHVSTIHSSTTTKAASHSSSTN